MAGKRQRRIRRTVSASTMGSGLNILEISPKQPKEKQKPANSPPNPNPNHGSDLPPAMVTAIPDKRIQGVKDGEDEAPPPLMPQKVSAIFLNESPCWDAYEELVSMALPAMNFLEACCFCKRRLGHGLDIYMYRGDQAFCSEECRHEQILLDESKDKCSLLALRMKISASPVRSTDQQTSNTAAAR